MSYTRTAIAVATIVLSITTAGPGTQPVAASEGLAGPQPPRNWVSPHHLALQAPQAVTDPIATPAHATVVHTENREQADTANQALELMAAAGFELPPVTIHMHSDKDGCSQLNGYFVQIDGENVVHSCGNLWTLLHELTHVWDKNVLDEATRQEFMVHQGLDSWYHETWNQAGGEHLASIVAWAITGTHPTRIGYYDRDHLADAYEIAAGEQPPTLQHGRATQARVKSTGSTYIAQTSDGSIELLPQ